MTKSDRIVGVRDLRAHLSAHLRNVARGGEVVIGGRDKRPVARLVPAGESTDETHLRRLAHEGVIQPGAGKPGSAAPVRPRRRGRLASDVVREDRD